MAELQQTDLKKVFGDKDNEGKGQTHGFSLQAALNGGTSFNQQAKPKRVSYKAVLNETGNVQFTSGNTHVLVTNENASGERKDVQHQLPVLAIKRYCDMLTSGKIKPESEEEVKNAELLQKAVAPYAKLAQQRRLN